MRKITKEELERFYRFNTNKKACEMLGISEVTLLKYIDIAGIKRKGKGNPSGENARKIELIK